MRLNSLQSQLLISYLALITVTLCVIGLALGLLLLSNPLQNTQAFQRLADINRAIRPYLQSAPGQLENNLAEIAQTNSIRILQLSQDGQVIYDSADEFTPSDHLNLRQSGNGPQNHLEFRDSQNQVWLAFASDPLSPGPNAARTILAIERPRFRLASLFEDNLFRSLLEAAVIGFAVSLIFAGIISNSVAQPLRQIARVASYLARGDYAKRTQVTGPHEVRELAVAFNGMADKVQKTQRNQKEFLANVTHELKTPLTSIQGYAQAILDRTSTDISMAAGVIFDEANRMQRLVEELLDLAKMEEGQIALQLESINIGELLQAVVTRFEPKSRERNIKLACDLDELPLIKGDGDRLVQLVTNLVDNAFNHVSEGGSISLQASASDGMVEITLRDSGVGIAPEHLPHIFERFYQADRSRSRKVNKGAGLGLAISREIVLAHRGQIQAESTPGSGATFHVWLPMG